RASLELLAMFVCLLVAAVLASAIRAHSIGALGVLATLAASLPYAAVWLYVSSRLPHRDAPWKALGPGAVLSRLTPEVISVDGTYVVGAYALAKQGTYGALGVAAVLLFGLFVFSRTIVFAAVVNATLWERRVRYGQRT